MFNIAIVFLFFFAGSLSLFETQFPLSLRRHRKMLFAGRALLTRRRTQSLVITKAIHHKSTAQERNKSFAARHKIFFPFFFYELSLLSMRHAAWCQDASQHVVWKSQGSPNFAKLLLHRKEPIIGKFQSTLERVR